VVRVTVIRGPGTDDGHERGQLVLLASVVVALAFVAMFGAYLQLGYQADVATSGVAERPVENGQSFLVRATGDAARDVRTGDPADGDAAVTALRDGLRPRLQTLEASRVEEGIAYVVAYNDSAADAWAAANCPGGPGRTFGPCHVDRGVVTQERAGQPHLLAAGFDLTVTTDDGHTTVTVIAAVAGE